MARMVIIAGGLVILIILFVVIFSLLSHAGSAQKQRLLETAQAQTELIRIATIGKDKASDLGVRSLAATTSLSVASEQQDVINALAKRGVKGNSLTKQLGTSKNTKTDTALDEAVANNRFDDTFLELINKQLNDYKRLLQSSSSGATVSEQKSLQVAVTNVNTIQKSKQLQPAGTAN